MANTQVIIVKQPGMLGRSAAGPFRSSRAAAKAREQVEQMGWDYHETLTLISGADLKYRAAERESDG
jgi:hypothetical protein